MVGPKIISPLFLTRGSNVNTPLPSIPSESVLSIDRAIFKINSLLDSGIKHFLLFEVSQKKFDTASEILSRESIIPSALKEFRAKFPDAIFITDICVCHLTSHGQCGLIIDNKIDNDESVKLFAKIALSHAQAGAHMLMPSSVSDGVVKAIRDILNFNGFKSVKIISQGTKFASAFYGPYREVALFNKEQTDKSSYQIDPANKREGIRKALIDAEESADIIMVKPSLYYLDIISKLSTISPVPVAAFITSGEYAMFSGPTTQPQFQLETALKALSRAGVSYVVTYGALNLCNSTGLQQRI